MYHAYPINHVAGNFCPTCTNPCGGCYVYSITITKKDYIHANYTANTTYKTYTAEPVNFACESNSDTDQSINKTIWMDRSRTNRAGREFQRMVSGVKITIIAIQGDYPLHYGECIGS